MITRSANLAAGRTDWTSDELFYDLLHSFHDQTVFNSENHLIPDGSPANHVPMAHTQAVYWQGGLHHQGVTTQWVWSEPTEARFPAELCCGRRISMAGERRVSI